MEVIHKRFFFGVNIDFVDCLGPNTLFFGVFEVYAVIYFAS